MLMGFPVVRMIRASGGNLRPWLPGQSGNPSGRPKSRYVKDAIEAVYVMLKTALIRDIHKETGADERPETDAVV